MSKIDRNFFVEMGRAGGKARGPSKRRGSKAYYEALSAKAAAARKRKREEKK